MDDAHVITPEEREFRRIAGSIKNPIEIRIGFVPFETKVNALGAALQAVRIAHQDEMSAKSWAILNQVDHLLCEAIFYQHDRRRIDASKPGAPFLETN